MFLLRRQLGVQRAIGQVQVGDPVGVFLVNGVFFVNVVGHVIDQNVLVPFVNGLDQRIELLHRPKPAVGSGRSDGPVAMVATEFTRDVRIGVRPVAPGSVGVGGDGADPDGVGPKVLDVVQR